MSRLSSVLHIEEVRRTGYSVTFDYYLDGEWWGRMTRPLSAMNMEFYEIFKRERKAVSYIQESYN